MNNTHTFLEQLDWRFATKAFDSNKHVSDEDLHKILHAARMAPTSYGLQPFHVYVVKDPELRKKMKAHSYMQSQVTDSSHVLVFCTRDDIVPRVDDYIDVASGGKKTAAIKLAPMKLVMKTSMKKKQGDAAREWAHHQTYIALGFALAACAELGIDSCPMEGFDSDDIGKLLDVPEHMRPVAYLAIGYRKEEPSYEKVRFPESDLFTYK